LTSIVLRWFGHGLGYTTWDYADAEVAYPRCASGDLVVSVRLKNTGARPGRETIQIYASQPDSAVARPPRWLAGFGQAEAARGPR
jgi:beta-glucosidase